ncbi:hypothetical protein [Paenibacillus sp. XY044]|uniref:hypothetical protein n=1 Tax=Paenibacillus sp. XY044 TaxID=2026089 RepID=UPI000B99D4CA|nr:hypothetical protein [Paenibacillus sp. XY044]OZB90058.1 hypothetical protein CJP46_35355 [Paenibacillus sp. XY044]
MAQWQMYPRNLDTRGDSRQEVMLSGGIFTGINSFDIKDEQSVNEYGWDTDEFYPAKSTAKAPVAYGASGNARTYLLTNFGSTQLVRAVGSTLQYNSSGTWNNISGSFSSIDWSAANFDINGPALILTNGSDTVRYWNGSTLNTLSSAPKGRIVAADNLRVFISNVPSDESQDQIHYCAFQDATDWSSAENSGIVQYYTANGGPVTAMTTFGGCIWVFKKDAFALIYHTGDARAFYRLVPSSDNIGCVNPKTLVDMGSFLAWLGQDDVYIGAAGAANRIGEPVRTFISRINQTYLSKCCAFTDGLRYYLNLVIDTATEPNIRLVYDTRFKTWQVAGINEQYLYGVRFNNAVYAGNVAGMTYKLNAATTTGAWMVETKDFDRSEAEKEYNEIHAQMYAPTGTTVTFQVSTDQGNTWQTIGDPIQGSSSAQNQNIIVPLDVVPIANWIRFRFSGTGPFRLYSFERYFKTHPVQI